MDELERAKAALALMHLEMIMGPTDHEPVLLVVLDGERAQRSRPRGKLKLVASR